jgi:predicted lipoprotein with Yx(FWY)xxD motif
MEAYMKYLLFAAVVAIPAAALALPASIGVTPSGNVLQAPDGHTLYVYDGDKSIRASKGSRRAIKTARIAGRLF